MRNELIFITVAVLIAGGVSAAQTTAEIANGILDDIEKELSYYSGTSDTGGEVAGSDMMAEPAAGELPELDATVEPAETVADVDALVEESREQYVAGEFEKSQQGFQQVVKMDPQNIWAKLYLGKLLERDKSLAETAGMEQVSEEWNTGLVLRTYPINDKGRESMKLEDETDRVNVQNRFPDVEFPRGASAIYQPKLEKIFVRNTRENLKVLEEILEAMDVASQDTDVDQVEIEAKFVEVSEGTLEELGFQWNMEDPRGITLGGTELQVRDGSSGLLADALRGSPSGASPELPFSSGSSLNPAGQEAASFVGGDSGWNTFSMENTFNTLPASMSLEYRDANPVDVLISALDQSSGADVLSAPRVTTRNGETATIRVGELHYFPEVYEGDSTEATLLNISYQDFSEILLGIELEVTPEIDGDQIELELNPHITELAGWQNYQLAAANTIYNHRFDNIQPIYNHPAIVAKLPIYKTRQIETVVSIADGSTIGMGGLMSEKVVKFKDQVPVLGHIPLLGRLFRNEGERSIKRNLLMFVTAKKVTPSGSINTSRSFDEGSDDNSSDDDDSGDDLFSF